MVVLLLFVIVMVLVTFGALDEAGTGLELDRAVSELGRTSVHVGCSRRAVMATNATTMTLGLNISYLLIVDLQMLQFFVVICRAYTLVIF